jgi:SAM-dependent methyltransferase
MPQQLNKCPVCQSASLKSFLMVKDYSVSGQEFKLDQCSECGFVFTNPRPGPEEIGPYYKSENYISHTNSSRGLMNKVYQLARARAINVKLKLIEAQNPRHRTLLDYGCGTGEFLAAARKVGFNCAGIEPDSEARERARSNHKLIVEAPDHLSKLPQGSFGVITLWHVLEHVHELDETIKQLKRCLSSEGVLIVAVPNRTAYDADKYGNYWAAYDVPRHLYHFSIPDMQRLMNEAGFTCHTIKPMFFDPYYIGLLSTKYQGNMNPLRAFTTGLATTLSGRKDISKNSSLIYVFRHK